MYLEYAFNVLVSAENELGFGCCEDDAVLAVAVVVRHCVCCGGGLSLRRMSLC